MLSLKTKAYYLVKPLVPHRLAIALRRRLGQRKRITHAATWPVDPRSGGTPPGWPGWPGGKRFAFVLTHDVEGPKGVARVRDLLALEAKQGWRSSYNFVPGDGEIPADLRQAVRDSGGEVGVHGLEHDGKLFFSKPIFEQKAARIREYMRDWGATGFRAPFMHHKLSWIHKLGAAYDSSTFDTDPFEPQPDGVRTIFPFWVPAADGVGGYVELPYTLVQDFTLFRILGDSTIDVWKKKLDWIAERGGMALLDTHPDYMHFGAGPAGETEYPARLYEEFLEYARSKYGDVYWHALPHEVAQYYREAIPQPAARNTRKRICMVTSAAYEPGSRIRKYAEALASRGDFVDVIAPSSEPREQMIGGVQLIPVRSGGPGFLLRVALKLTRLHGEIQYDCVHVHDWDGKFGLAAYFAKRDGAKVILDRQEFRIPADGFWPRTSASLLEAHVIQSPEAAYLTLVDSLAVERFSDLQPAP